MKQSCHILRFLSTYGCFLTLVATKCIINYFEKCSNFGMHKCLTTRHAIQQEWCRKLNLQVSLAIRGGYVPYKSQTVNTKNAKSLIRLKNSRFPSLFAFLNPRKSKLQILRPRIARATLRLI